jgi:alpha-galactosidase
MVNPDSELFRAHPEWTYAFPDRPQTELRQQLVLNCARQDVRDYLFEKIDALVKEIGIAFIKWDMNRPITEGGWATAPNGEAGRIWQDHALGVYDLMARLRAANPGLEIESCASGGSRIDIGIMERTEQIWTSDNTDAYDRLFIQHGYSMAYSPRAMMAWVTHLPNWATDRQASLRFRFHVAMAGGLGIGEALNKMSEAQLAECASWIGIYKDIRQTVQYGSQYRILPPEPGKPTAVQYVAADASESIVFTYWPLRRWGDNARDIKLGGLDPEALYRCERIEDPDTNFEDINHQRELSGAAWMQRGLRLDLRGDYASAIYRLTPKS